MTLLPGAADNTDCDLVAKLWGLLGNPGSGEWYLGSIINNGLDVPSFGINIPPFPSVTIGDIPEQTMFDWALEHLGISMSGTVLNGLGTFTGGDVKCTPVSGSETDVTLTLNFAQVVYTGSYDVGASGVTGCALATASSLLGNAPSRAASATGDPRLDLASWYRDNDQALPATQNGKVLLGQYYLNQDAIEEVTTSDSSAAAAYRSVLSQQKPVADAVTQSTSYWQQQVDGQKPPGPPPTIGAGNQYVGGIKTYTYLNMAVQQSRVAADLPLEPGNDYSELQNSMAHLNASILKYQKDHPGEHDTAAIMSYVADAPPTTEADLLEIGVRGIPVHGDTPEEIVDHVPLWPIDHERSLRAYAARAPRAAANDWFHVKGTFADEAQQLGLTVTAAFTATTDGKLVAKATGLSLTIGSLHITLGNKSGFDSEPGLYDKVSSWIANTASFQDTLISKLNSGLNSEAVLSHLSDALNAGLKKLGFQ